ncbi:MAG: DUF1232 domain-containing protein [Romboutsia sp.]
MNNLMKIIDIFLDGLKKVLVRFKDAKFGLSFIINIFKIPDFLSDNRVNIISKLRLIFAMLIALIYIVSGIDFIPEMIAGIFGFIDDIFVVVWTLGIANEEIEKYKKMIKDEQDPNVIKDVEFSIKDERE